jgi:DNA-binding transcriptional LysR family regulator
MDLRSLQYFCSVYEQQSFSSAARVCFIAQPSISSAISQLEQTLETELFIRHTRGVKNTGSAERLYPLAKKLLGQADAIKVLFKKKDTKEVFYLGVTKGLGVERMSALLKDFTASQPLMELTLVSHTDHCDARIITKEELDEKEFFIKLWQEDYLLALPYNHALSLKDTVTMSDLDELPFIQRTQCSAWNTLNDTMTLSGLSVDIRASIRTIDYALGLVQAGLGCALVPAHSEVIRKRDIVFRSIEGLSLTREVLFSYQEKSQDKQNIIDSLQQLIVKHR